MAKRSAQSSAALRALALSAGKRHADGMRFLEKRGGFRPGAPRDLRKQLTTICRIAKVSPQDRATAFRIIDLVTPVGDGLPLATRVVEVRKLCRELASAPVHPMVLALASIVDDSLARAARTIKAHPHLMPAVGVRKTRLTVLSEDAYGFMLGYETGTQLDPTGTGIYGLYLGVSGAYHYSRSAVDLGLPLY